MLSLPNKVPLSEVELPKMQDFKAIKISLSYQSGIPFPLSCLKSQLALNVSSSRHYKGSRDALSTGCAVGDCRLNPQGWAGYFLRRGCCSPQLLGSVPSLSPSPREKCSTEKPTCGSPLRRECDLPTIPSPYIVRIGQFDKALYPLHIVREDTLRKYAA